MSLQWASLYLNEVVMNLSHFLCSNSFLTFRTALGTAPLNLPKLRTLSDCFLLHDRLLAGTIRNHPVLENAVVVQTALERLDHRLSFIGQFPVQRRCVAICARLGQKEARRERCRWLDRGGRSEERRVGE